MTRAVLVAAIILILLAPVVADFIKSPEEIRRQLQDLKEGLKREHSDAYNSAKEQLAEMRQELRGALHEKEVEFKKGIVEGEVDMKYGPPYEHMPTLDEKLNEMAHDTGYVAGATKEKVSETAERIKEGAAAAKEKVEDRFKHAADAAKEKLKDIRDSAKEKADEARHSFEQAKETTKEKAESAKEKLKEKLKEAADTAKDRAHKAGEALKEGAEQLKEETEDLIGHAKWKADYAKHQAEETARDKLNKLKEEVQAETHHLKHGAEAVKEKGSALKDELKDEAKHIKEEATGVWHWLRNLFLGTRDSIAEKLKREEVETKSKIAQRLHEEAAARAADAKKARLEYEAMLAKAHNAKTAELHKKLEQDVEKLREAAIKAEEVARSAFEEKDKLLERLKHIQPHHIHQYYHLHVERPLGDKENLAAGCSETAREILREAKAMADAGDQCNLKEETQLAAELRKAREQREFITETETVPPVHGEAFTDRVKRMLHAINPFDIHH